MNKGDVLRRRHVRKIAMIGNDQRHIHADGADADPVQQIDQGMAKFGHHDNRPRFAAAVEELRFHGELLPDGREFGFQPGNFRIPFRLAMHPHEKTPIVAVAELLAVQDVAVALEQETAHLRHNAAAVGTGERQDKIGIAHGQGIAAARAYGK